jgi:N-acetylglucosaminyl-diphospho-decaprenol L-rhamnosyltransferase
MRICAVILDYRGAIRTEACLRSLLGEGLDTVLVVDNSADECSSAELAAVVNRLRAGEIDYALHVLNPDSNLGFARGVNFALRDAVASRCEAFLLLNNDATAVPGMVSRLVATLEHEHADLVAPHIVDRTGKSQPILWYQRHLGLLTSRPLPFSFPYMSGCCVLFRRELLVASKLFDEDFFMYGEDTFLGWQLIHAGKAAVQSKEAIVYHFGQGSSEQCKMFYEYHTARAHVLLALRTWRSPLEIPLLIIAKGLGLMLRALRRSIRYRSGIPLMAFFLSWLPLQIRTP